MRLCQACETRTCSLDVSSDILGERLFAHSREVLTSCLELTEHLVAKSYLVERHDVRERPIGPGEVFDGLANLLRPTHDPDGRVDTLHPALALWRSVERAMDAGPARLDTKLEDGRGLTPTVSQATASVSTQWYFPQNPGAGSICWMTSTQVPDGSYTANRRCPQGSEG